MAERAPIEKVILLAVELPAPAGLRQSRDSSHSSETPRHEPAPHGGVDPGRKADSGGRHTRTFGAYRDFDGALGPVPATMRDQVQAGRPACHLRAIRGGLWRFLTVTHGHSGHSDLRHASIGGGPHEW